MIATYQTRVADYDGICRDGGDAALSAYAELYGRLQRKLFAAAAAGNPSTTMKRDFLRRYRIPARMFNSLRVSLDGKMAAIKESMALRRDSLERNIARTQGQVARAKSRGRLQVAHQRRRKLDTLERRLAALNDDIQTGRVRLLLRLQETLACAAQPEGQWVQHSRGVAQRLAGVAEQRVLRHGQPGMRPPAVNFASPPSPRTGPSASGSGCPTPWPSSTGSTSSSGMSGSPTGTSR